MDSSARLHFFFAGLWAGTINSVVGSGTLVTFPVLIALGYAPVTASISNAMGLVAGTPPAPGATARSSPAAASSCCRLLPASLLGGITGACLLLHLPEKVFHYAAPVLIVLALLMVVFQPRLQQWVRNREENPEHAIRDKRHGVLLVVLVYLAGVYGGYFVAAQGILLVGILGVFMTGTIQNANAMKNILVLGREHRRGGLLPALRLRPDRLDSGRADRRELADRRLIGSKVGPPAVPGGPARRSSSSSAWWPWGS